MNKKLTVVLDGSGSFAENGKQDVLRAMYCSVGSLAKSFGGSAEFFIWREDVRPLTKMKEIVAGGRNEIPALVDFISACPFGTKILLLSDGLWSSDGVAKIKSAVRQQNIHLIFVAVGADANRSKIFDVSTLGGVWSPVDLPAAVQTILLAGDVS